MLGRPTDELDVAIVGGGVAESAVAVGSFWACTSDS
jgi:hypothetical protein